MKKLLAITLALAMILAMSATVFAAEEFALTVAYNRTYDGYKLLNLTTSLKEGDDCTGDHNEDCYNYAYTVNGKYLDILKALVNPDDATAVTEQDVIDYLRGLTSDADKRTAADALYAAIVANDDIDADAPDLTGTTTLGQGYWLFADKTNVAGQEDLARSLVLVNTQGQLGLTITPKTDLPTVVKQVKDEADDVLINEWVDAASVDTGDTVYFKLTATLPNDVLNYENYTLVFHDNLSAGLQLNQGSIRVYQYNNATAAAADAEDARTELTITPKFTDLDENCDFEVAINDVLALNDVNQDTVFVVYYTATLTGNDVVIGTAGNPNEVTLVYSNDPYGDSTGKTSDEVVVNTYQLTVNKVDGSADGKPALAGATFKLEKLSNGQYVEVENKLTTNQDGTQFVWAGLDAGTYRLTETEAPAGYNQAAPVEITITNDNVIETVENNTGAILPETGAQGTFMLITGGALLVVLATVFMVTRKKMSVYED